MVRRAVRADVEEVAGQVRVDCEAEGGGVAGEGVEWGGGGGGGCVVGCVGVEGGGVGEAGAVGEGGCVAVAEGGGECCWGGG